MNHITRNRVNYAVVHSAIKSILFFSALVLLIFHPVFASAGGPPEPVILGNDHHYDLGPHLAVFADKKELIRIKQPDFTDVVFTNHEGRTPNLGILQHPVWVKFSLSNPSDQDRSMFLSFNYPVTDSVELLIPCRGKYKVLNAGDCVPASPEILPHRNFMFPITIPAGCETDYYMRIKSPMAALTTPIELYDPEEFYTSDSRNQTVYGMIFGAVIFFSIYFAAMSFKLREASDLWFALYISFFGLLLAIRKGFLQDLLGPNLVYLNNYLDILVIGGLYFSGARLMRSFLNVGFYSRRIDYGLAFLQWLGLVFIPVALWIKFLSPPVGLVLFILGPIFSSSVAIMFWIRRTPNAKYFAFGWLAGHATSVIDCLRISGIIPYDPLISLMIPASLTCCLVFYTMAIVEKTHTYKYFADQDGLTGLANRRYFDKLLEAEWFREQRHQRPLALIMVDVDYFKQYNDTYGHRAGDAALVKVAEVLMRFARRPGDLAARYGGEEFVVMLAETGVNDVGMMAEKIRSEVMNLKIPHSKGVVDVLTVSLGAAATIPSEDKDKVNLLTAADEALYRAKQSGRNQVYMDRS